MILLAVYKIMMFLTTDKNDRLKDYYLAAGIKMQSNLQNQSQQTFCPVKCCLYTFFPRDCFAD